MKKTKDPELVRLEENVLEAEEEERAAQEQLGVCADVLDAAEKELAAFKSRPAEALLFGSGVRIDGLPACVLSFDRVILELVVEGPRGFHEMRFMYVRGEGRVEVLPFDEGVELFNRFRAAGRI